ncbi:antibiotic biosynthesis monooxygenase family protein [Peribacillus huizhouensis]|uniref:Heme-degrading monooxygenase HmoA n=1 Tax=Peribacillus huizhouensis TaxID=1501239 RepID=A0ABR6CKL3_9BACI|nr:antibiotic biosynthesis monooxygenase [Peribacillus huizhouensis]MBA9025251.1 heme-degrading monooxygenase HmoA [Peribacillus huizhouensis]
MNVFITTGTREFLQKVKEKHADKKLYFMGNAEHALLLHETPGKTIFSSPRKFEVVDGRGELKEDGYVVMNNIPVTEEGRPGFEFRFKNRAGLIEKEPGFTALRILRPLNSDTYVILTMWVDQRAFTNWKNSNSFQSAHSKNDKSLDNPDLNKKIFSGPAYVTQYSLITEEDQ